MIASDKPNPFRVLALLTDATRADIVTRGQELYDTAETEEERQLFRWAREQLITNPRTRLEYELFEMPDAHYEDQAWESFVRAHKRKPVDLNALTRDMPPPTIDDIDVVAVIRLLLDQMVALPAADISVAIDESPYVPAYRLPLEVRDVIFG